MKPEGTGHSAICFSKAAICSVRILACATEASSVLPLSASRFFFAFSIDVAPAMAQLDGSGYVATQQWINRVVRNAGVVPAAPLSDGAWPRTD